MKKLTVFLAIFFITFTSFAQKNFSLRQNFSGQSINGDFTMIGNQNINLRNNDVGKFWYHPDPNKPLDRKDRDDTDPLYRYTPYPPGDYRHNPNAWNNRTLDYIHIDKNSTAANAPRFQSSAATLNLPTLQNGCPLRIRYAALYWSGYTSNSNYRKVKLKLPGKNEYHDLTADESGTIGTQSAKQYYCFKDITNLLQNQGVTTGEYIVGDIYGEIANPGGMSRNMHGLSGGWSILVVYEYPGSSVTSKKINIYDGFQYVTRSGINMNLTGFTTVPSGPVNVRMGVMSVEGQLEWDGDYMEVNGHKMGQANSALPNWTDNFFDSSVTLDGSNVSTRRPASINNLGFDLDVFNVPNPGNSIIGNNTNALNVKLRATGDVYLPVVTAVSVENYEPKLEVETRVFKGGTDITNINNPQNVNKGDVLTYQVKVKNVGKADANFGPSQGGALPGIGVVLYYPNKLLEPLKTGVKPNVDLIKNELVFSNGANASPFDSAYYITGDTPAVFGSIQSTMGTGQRTLAPGKEFIVKFHLKVTTNDCDFTTFACSEYIRTYARFFADNLSYYPDFNVSSPLKLDECGDREPKPTEVRVSDISTASCNSEAVLCGNDIKIKAQGIDYNHPIAKIAGKDYGIFYGNYDTFKWKFQALGQTGWTNISGNNQEITINAPGVYRVEKSRTGANNCQTRVEEITVKTHAQSLSQHPLIPFAQEVYTCPDNGVVYPQLYLCGANAKAVINLRLTNAKNYTWQKRDNCNIPSSHDKECPVLENTYGCNWVTKATTTTNDYVITEAGDYRLTVTFQNNCVSTYYFKVTKNNLTYKVDGKDIICGKKGKITITGVNNTQYKFALKKGTATVTNYQTNPVFEIATPDAYTVLIKQNTVSNTMLPCVFSENVVIKKRTPSLTVTNTEILCKDGRTTIQATIADAYPPFSFTLRRGGATGAVLDSKTISSTTYTFPAQPAGTYFVQVTSEDINATCLPGKSVVINDSNQLKITAALAQPLMCGAAKVVLTAIGGKKAPYGYNFQLIGNGVNLNGTAQSTYTFTVSTVGTYTAKIVDANNCTVQETVAVTSLPAPTNTVTSKLINCGANGQITFSEPQSTVSYTYEYSVDGGTTFQTGREFIVAPGTTYNTVFRYKYGSSAACTVERDVTIGTGGNNELIASAGVAQLVSCGTGANIGKGLVHFTNVQGGQTPYEYNFGDGVWTSTRERWLAPGTYLLSVRDAAGCARTNLSVTVKDKPDTPIFTPSAITYDCQGKGTLTLGNNKPNYIYKYLIDGTETTTRTFKNLSPGVHTITVYYDDPSTTRPAPLLKEDFGKGNPYTTPPSGMTTAYTLIDPRYNRLDWNKYFVAGKRDIYNHIQTGWWQSSAMFPNDHTDRLDNTSRYLAVDFGQLIEEGAIFYEKDVMDVMENQPIEFEMFGYNLVSSYAAPGCALPVMIMEIVALDDAGNVVIEGGRDKVLGRIESQEIPTNGGNADAWFRFASDGTGVNTALTPVVRVNPGTYKRLKIRIRTKWNTTACNDFAFDDITVYQLPKTCGFTYTLTVNVANDKAFGVDPSSEVITQPKCNGDRGSYQITLKNAPSTYYVSKDGGAFVAMTGNLFRWINLNGVSHTVKIRAEQNNANCEVTRTFTIVDPSVITVSASNVILGCNGTTNITVTATGGTGVKQFSLRKGGTVLYGYQNSPVFTVNQTGAYTVYVRDANNCEKNTTVNVLSAPILTLTGTTNTANNNYCLQGGQKGKVEVEVRTSDNTSTAPYVFQHNGVTKATQNTNTYIFDNLNAGVHTFTVTDKYGCKATYSVEIKNPLSIDGTGASVSKDISCNAAPANQGEITLKVKDGYPPYRYVVKQGGGIVQNTQNVPTNNTVTYKTATSGSYTIEVTDSKGCMVSGSATLLNAVAPTVTVSTTTIGCYGANNGSLSLTITGGKAPYKVFLDGVAKGSQLVFNNLSAKSYTIKVVDANNCETTKNATISQPANPLQAFAGVSQLIGCGGTGANKDKAEVRITNPSGGTPPYQYKFDGNYGSSKVAWLPAGVHTVYVKDANGCELGMTVTVTARISEPTGTTYTITSYDCDGNATVRFTGIPTTYDYTYEIGGKTATGTTATITGLAPGNYTVTIKYKDANPPASSILIKEDFASGPDTCSSNVSSAFTCSPNGSNGIGPGKYVILNKNSAYLPMGGYPSIWIKPNDHTSAGADSSGRYFFVDVGNVGTGDILYHKQVNDIMPNVPIKYELYLLNLFRPGHGAKLPDVEIRLVSNGNTIASKQSGPLADNLNPDNWIRFAGELNPSNNTSIDIQIRTNSWANWGSDLCMDDIYVYQEAKSCEQSITKQVVVPSGKEFKASVVSITHATCKGAQTGKVTFKVENLGGAGYRISEVNGAIRSGAGYATEITAPTFEVDGLRPGVNTIKFSNRTCGIVRTVTITEPDELTLTATISEPAMCSNNTKARVTLTAGGGTPPYTYIYQVGSNVTTQTSNVFTGVAPGTPTFRVVDKNGCSTQLTGIFTVTTPTTVAFTTSATTCYSNNNNGEIAVKITQGNGGYKVKLNNNAAISLAAGATTHTFTGLTQGSYSVTVTDSYGCSSATQVRIYPSLNSTVKVTDQSCKKGKIEVTASGGNGTIEFAYKKQGDPAPTDSEYSSTARSFDVPDFTAASETWIVYVRSAACVKTHQVVVKKADNVAFTAATVTPTCQGSATGKIVLGNIKGDGNFKVSYGKAGTPVIANYTGIAGSSYTITNVAAGVYSVTLTDKYGCSTTQSITLADMPALTASISVSTSAGCLKAGSAATLTLSMTTESWNAYTAGGNQIYYSIDNGASWHPMPTRVYDIGAISGVTEPGKTIQVRFATRPNATAPNVCTTAAIAYIVPKPLATLSITTNIDKFTYNCTAAGTQYFTATVTVPTGVGSDPFLFNVNGGAYLTPTPANSRMYVFTGLVVGRTYTFGVKDKNGCEIEDTQDIYANVATPAMTATLIANPACNGASSSQATIKIHRSASYTSASTGATLNWTIYEKQPGLTVGTPIHTGSAVMPGVGQDATSFTPSAGPYALAPNKTYYVIVKEGTNCEWGSRDLYIREMETLSATVSQTSVITCNSDGVLEVQNPTGGGGTYRYTVTPITAGVTFRAPIVTGSSRVQIVKDNIATPAMPSYPSAAYNFGVKLEMEDQYGCKADLGTYTFTVTPAPDIAATPIVGCADGQYTLTIQPQAKTGASGAVAPAAEIAGYEYSIDSGINYQSSNVFGNLVAGAYDVQIRDKATGCIATKTVSITNALEASVALTTPLGCTGGAAGITVKVDNGSGDYEYTYTSPGGTPTTPAAIPQTAGEYKVTFNVTAVGVYTVTVKDKNAPSTCNTFTRSVTVNAAERPEITTSVKSVTCAGGSDGVIYITERNTAALGVAFTYAVQGPGGVTPAVGTNREITNVKAGLYTITVTANGCQNTYTATVKEPTALTLSKTLIENNKREFSCGSSGSVQQAEITVPSGAVQGGTSPYRIEYLYGTVSGTGNSFSIGNTAGGIVTITAIDANGCSTQTSVVIKPFEAFDVDKIDFAVTTTGTCNASETITINATQSSGAPFTGQLLYYQGATAPAGTLTPTAGGWQTSNSFTIAPNRTYTFWVANRATGCIASKLYISPNPNNFSIVNPQVKNVGCKGANNGTATFTLSNTVNGHAYNVTLSPAGGTITPAAPFTATGTTASFNIAGLAPNTYTVTVKDNNTACEQTYSFKIEEPTSAITASVTVHQATCASAPTYNSGEIAIENVTGGWGTYQYYIGQAAAGLEVWTNTSVRTGLTPGTYRVLVKDNNGCATTLSNTVTIATPTTISGTLTVTNANCTNGTGAIGVRSVTGGEGANYLYQLIKDGVAQGGAQTSTEFQNLSAGNYQVAISDSWGCTTTLTQSVTLYEPVEGVGVRFIKQVTCTPATGATISVTYAGGDSPSLRYTLKNVTTGVSTTSTTNGFTNVPAGNYEVSVYDVATGCPTQTHTFAVTDAATVSFTYTTTAVSCNGSSDGKLKITIPGTQTQTDYQINIVGSGGFTRSEMVNTTPKDIEFIAMPAGTYTVTLTSARNCTATQTIIIGAPAALIVSNTTTVTTHYKCDADNNAQQAIISAVAQGGTQPYKYNYQVFDGTNTSTSGWINSSVYSLTSAGSATQTVIVNVEDANGCRAVYTPMVVPPLQRISAVNATRISTLSCNQSETVNFTIVGGKNLGYVVEVTANGSVATPTPSTQTLTAGTNVATVHFNAAGYYTIKVTDRDTGCYATVSHTVNEYRTMEVSAAQSKPVSCVGDSNGEITVTFSGYQGAITYQVFNATTLAPAPGTAGTVQTQIGSGAATRTIVIGGLAKGSYVVRMVQTTAPNCTVTSSVVMVSEPATTITATPTVTDRIKCGIGQTGAFSVETTGGWGNYQYRLLVGGAPHSKYGTYTSTSLFEGLVSNTYTVEVKDENGCVATLTQVMAAPAPISANVTHTDVTCFGAREGSITVQSISGGSGNYTYELKELGGAIVRGAQTSTTFTGLDARTYVLNIIDGWGCDAQVEITIDEPSELGVVASIASPLTCNNPATVSITVTGGTPPYTYYQVGNATPLAGNSIQVGNGGQPLGDYEFYVTDSKGCRSKVSNKVSITALEALQLHVNTEDAFVKCNGESSARITFSATGALGNYQYKLYKSGVHSTTASATQVNATDWAFTGLNKGKYQVEVISVDCTVSRTVDVDESPAFTVATATTDITCNAMRDGTISMTVTGGAGDVQYAISPRLDRFVSEGYFTNLGRGQYVVRAQDKNGCFVDEVFTIHEPDVLNAVIHKQTDEVCYGAGDGTVSITITGGTQSYSTSIDGGAWTVDKTLYTGLSVGVHTITVKDARSCTTEVPVTIKEGVDLQATATVSYGCGNNTVVNTINATVNASYTGAVSFSLDGGAPQNSGKFTGVTAGVHSITFTHLNGCTTTLTVNVTAYNSLTATTATKTDMSCYGINDGTITFAVSGATNSYTYTITPEAGTFDGVSKYTGLSAGIYTVKVRSNGEINCELEQSFTIEEPELLKATASTVSETCYQANDGSLSFSIRGGRAPYNFTIKTASGTTVTNGTLATAGAVYTQTNVAGVYLLEYNDGNCSQTLEITVPKAPNLEMNVKTMFNCSTVSTTYTTSYLRIEFPYADENQIRNMQYSLGGGPMIAFDRYEGKYAYTRTIPTGQYTLTVQYQSYPGAPYCTKVYGETVSLTRYPGLELEDKSDPRSINTVKVQAKGGNSTQYIYYFNGFTNGTNEYMLRSTDPTTRVVGNRVYKTVVVEVTDANGCSSTLTIEKEYMKSVPPDFFTPNGDGQNDGWDPDRYRSYPNLTVDIYDRYGRYITTLRSGQTWDGRYNGKELPTGDYWYILKTHEEGEDDHEYMGHFNLYRAAD
ncbi:T9SS type B sorting domain-containing protein [Capnocytophaga sputigena]|uniref:T9SS type B sorting domain-containing protein n=5 Tax=Capnocytophaga sputigena TaxID=1019 RepID=UPI000BB1AD19|nr:T9SS type B sorting domain-containing protein [Capnocytophaga sputigena]ATA70070.1 gliding motility protein [Capnocytophaga sputigena]